jgi:zinc/manganese transport system substrate-binding protein
MLNLRRRSLLKTTVSALCVAATTQVVHADEPIPVVATFSILGDMVSEIGGEHVNVTTLVGPDGDAHVYQPTPKDARSVSEAELMFMNGLEFEGWLERLVKAASFGGSLVVATDGIQAIAFDDHDDHDDHDEHDDHDDHDDTTTR